MIEREDTISDYTRLPAKRLPSNTCAECVLRWHAIWLRRVGTRYINEAVIASEAKQSGHLTTRGLTPTEAGRNFYNRAARSIEEADGAELAARGAAATLSGRLRVQVTVAFGRLQVTPHVPTFLAQHPAIDVDIVFDDRNINLVEAGINIGLRWSARQFRINRPQDCASERRVIGTPSYLIA